MECRSFHCLEINVRSASDLKELNTIGKMDPYVTVSLSNDPKSKQKTEVHTNGSKNPTWKGSPMTFPVDMSLNSTLVLKIMAEKPFGNKEVGEVIVPVKDLFQGQNYSNDQTMERFVSYSVTSPSGKSKGTLNFSYKIRVINNNVAVYPPTPSYVPQPQYGVALYPPQHFDNVADRYPPPYSSMHTMCYPPPHPQPPFVGYPPQQEYGYPGSYGYQQGQGYLPAQMQMEQNNHGGKKRKEGGTAYGLASIGAGLLGGMVLGELF